MSKKVYDHPYMWYSIDCPQECPFRIENPNGSKFCMHDTNCPNENYFPEDCLLEDTK